MVFMILFCVKWKTEMEINMFWYLFRINWYCVKSYKVNHDVYQHFILNDCDLQVLYQNKLSWWFSIRIDEWFYTNCYDFIYFLITFQKHYHVDMMGIFNQDCLIFLHIDFPPFCLSHWNAFWKIYILQTFHHRCWYNWSLGLVLKASFSLRNINHMKRCEKISPWS